MSDAANTQNSGSLTMLRITNQHTLAEGSYCAKIEGDMGYEVGCDRCGWWRNIIPQRWKAYWLLFRHDCEDYR